LAREAARFANAKIQVNRVIPGSLSSIYDLTDSKNFRDYLKSVNQRLSSGLNLDPQDISTSKALLFYYFGYSMGDQRGNKAALAGDLDDKISSALSKSLDAFSQSPEAEQQKRYDFYSKIRILYSANGQATRARYLDLTQDGRTIRVNWDKSFSNTASDIDVSADEALRKTDFLVYQAVVDAAFKTDGLRSFTINGAWRPHPADYAAILGRPSPLPNEQSPHISSRALDINVINEINIRNGGYVNHAPASEEPDIILRFTDNLRDEDGVRQIFQPWRLLYNANNPTALFVTNFDVKKSPNGQFARNSDGNATLHSNHLHIGF
jgi:hypothetical protein